MARFTAPNLFELKGTGVAVTYSTTSIDGTPRFTFKKGRQTLNFSGNQITTLAAGIGTLVSVMIASIPDKSTTTFSVLLPAILVSGSNRQAFRTLGITTVAATSIAGVKGVQQTYKTVLLRGSARVVTF